MPTTITATHTPAGARMKRHKLPLPTLEDRDQLLNIVYGDDPQPPRCDRPGHDGPAECRAACITCGDFYRWRARMHRRFAKRGLAFSLNDREYADQPPPPCPHGHAFNPANCKACRHCKNLDNWKRRQRKRLRDQGVDTKYTDLDTLTAHLRLLRDRAVSVDDITRRARCGRRTVQTLLAGRAGDANRIHVRTDVARRLLDIQVPDRTVKLVPDVTGAIRRRVDATGTHRRIQAACRARHSIEEQARRLGWARCTLKEWMAADTVPLDAADAIAALYPTLIANPGDNNRTAGMAAAKNWTEARYFSATNIDDPAYHPFAIVDDPIGVYRRLRALAWMGQGPQQVAAFIDESPEQVEIWMEGGPAPAYAAHMVDAAFEKLSGAFGPDDQLRERARGRTLAGDEVVATQAWAPPLAWYGVDIDNPRAHPYYDLPSTARKTHYPLDSQVFLALIGRISVRELFREERIKTVRFLHRLRWSDRRIAAYTRWHADGDLAKAVEAIQRFRLREGITGFGSTSGHDRDRGLIFTPTP